MDITSSAKLYALIETWNFSSGHLKQILPDYPPKKPRDIHLKYVPLGELNSWQNPANKVH
jgi:hypothetical protein